MMNRRCLVFPVLAAAVLLAAPAAAPQRGQVKLPETAVPLDLLKTILNEVSGQIAFNNEAVMAAHLPPRAEEEYTGVFFEADYMARTLRSYGLDDVALESIDKGVDPRKWWAAFEGDLWMTQPERKLLGRLAADAALVVRGSDTVDAEGDLVYLDLRDRTKIKDMDFAGKIILTGEYPGYFSEAFKKGALGIVSYYNSIRPLDDPDQVMYDMSFQKAGATQPVFAFKISQRLGYELRDLLLQGRPIKLRAKTRTAEFPLKFDTVYAAIKGTAPERKGLMFTAHLFERPQKQGANDNLSGAVVLAEVARTLQALIRQGLIPRPERTIHFLWVEEGSGTMAFFRKHPDMAGRLLGAINMDMVGENLDRNSAFFNIETPLYSRSTFLSAAAKDFAEFVFTANLTAYSIQTPTPWMPLPFPIAEKNGSLQTFRFRMIRYEGGSDHGIFLEADEAIPALSFNVWPDASYHTDKDTIEKSDPTQLKRVAFIAAAAALAVSSGREDILKGLVREAFADRVAFIQETAAAGATALSRLEAADQGAAYQKATEEAAEAVRLGRNALSGLGDLVREKAGAAKALDLALLELSRLGNVQATYLRDVYLDAAKARGFAAVMPKPSADEARLRTIVPRKIKPASLGRMFPFNEIFQALGTDRALQTKIFSQYGINLVQEFFIAVDGRTSLAQIRSLLGLEFAPVAAADILALAKCLENAKLIAMGPAK